MISVNGKLVLGQNFCAEEGTPISRCMAFARRKLSEAVASLDRQADSIKELREASMAMTKAEASNASKKPAKSGRWTPAEEARVIDLRNRGFTCAQIGEVIGRCPDTIKLRCYWLNKWAKDKGEPLPIASKFKLWTDAERDVALAMSKDGRGVEQIAAALGRSVGALKVELSHLRRKAGHSLPA